MTRHVFISVLTLILFSKISIAQDIQAEIDSMLNILPQTEKSERPYLLNAIAKAYIRVDPQMVLKYAGIALKESQELKLKDAEIKSYNHLGIGYAMISDFEKSIENFEKSIKLAEEIQDPKQYAYALDNLGNVYIYQNKYELALEQKQRALKIKEAIKDEEGILTSLVNIATLFDFMQAHDKAIESYKIAIARSKLLGDDYSLLACYENVAVAYHSLHNHDTSLMYIDSVFALGEKMGIPDPSSLCYDLLGGISRSRGDYNKAIEYYQKEISLIENSGQRESICNAYNNIGKTYCDLKEYGKAESFLKMGLEIALEIDSKLRIYEAFHGLATVYENTGRYKEAAAYYGRYISLKDSVLNENVNQQIAEMEARFQDEKVQLENQNLKKQQALDQLKIENEQAIADSEKLQKRFYAGGLIVAGVLIVLVLVGFVQKKRDNAIIREQKREVELQKEIVDEKNKEIFDSITYAKRIQEAILPPQPFIDRLLPDNFVLYKPKDIVAGDFYWIEHVGDKIILAVADCTGHGVPGAMVSVVCHNALNRSVREFGFTEPEKILDKTRELILETFARSEKNVNDGMDISICTINHKRNELRFAGANNDVLVLRNNDLIELKADKQPVGKFDAAAPFTSKEMQIQRGDMIYLFTDGYADQFGGDKGKKFKYQSFKKLLQDCTRTSMPDQKREIDHAFETWKAEFEQVDDVCIIGVKL